MSEPHVVYEKFRSLDRARAAAIPLSYFERARWKHNLGESAEAMRDKLILGIHLAHQLQLDDFVDWVRRGELPPVKLTARQMELLRGGGGFGDVFSALIDFLRDPAGAPPHTL